MGNKHRSFWGPLDFFGFALITPGPVAKLASAKSIVDSMLKAARPCLQQHEEQSLLNRVPRQLAGLLFEFVFPGQRHASFPPRADSLPLPHRKRYDNTRTIVRKFKLEYEGSKFQFRRLPGPGSVYEQSRTESFLYRYHHITGSASHAPGLAF